MRKSPLHVVHGFGRAAGLVVVEERLHDGLAEALARVERDVRHAERVAGRPRSPNGVGRAARPRGVGRVRVDPEPQRDADGLVAAVEDARERDGGVDAPGHGDGGADAARRVRKRVDGGRHGLGERIERHGRTPGTLGGDRTLREASREAQRCDLEQRGTLRPLGAPGGRSTGCRAAESPVAGFGDASIRPEPELHPHAIAAGRAAGGAVAIGALELPGAGEILAGEPHACTAAPAARSIGTSVARASTRRAASSHGVALAEADAERAERERAPHSHGRERAARLLLAAVAGSARRDGEAVVVEQRAERIASHLLEAARGCGREAARRPTTRTATPGELVLQHLLVGIAHPRRRAARARCRRPSATAPRPGRPPGRRSRCRAGARAPARRRAGRPRASRFPGRRARPSPSGRAACAPRRPPSAPPAARRAAAAARRRPARRRGAGARRARRRARRSRARAGSRR